MPSPARQHLMGSSDPLLVWNVWTETQETSSPLPSGGAELVTAIRDGDCVSSRATSGPEGDT